MGARLPCAKRRLRGGARAVSRVRAASAAREGRICAGNLQKILTCAPFYIIIKFDKKLSKPNETAPCARSLRVLAARKIISERSRIMVLKVCVGSSCHLRGSYDVIEEMKRLIKKYDVEDKIDLQATFCVGNCTHGVSVLADELLVHGANKDNCEELFLTQIYPLVK